MRELQKLIGRLKRHYGDPERSPAKGPFELVLWESCYLLPDERRTAVFEVLRQRSGWIRTES